MVKKCHTKIVLCASDRTGRAIEAGRMKSGQEVDFRLFKVEFSPFKYRGRGVWVDLGFLGIRRYLSDVTIKLTTSQERLIKVTTTAKPYPLTSPCFGVSKTSLSFRKEKEVAQR